MLLKLKDLNKIQLIFIIISINLILRSFFFFSLDLNTLNFSDQTKYLSISDTLLIENNFNNSHTLMRTPGYPLFLYFLRYIMDNLIFIILIQNLIGVLTTLLIYNTSKLISKKYNLFFTFIFSININVILYQNLILTESLFITFFLISLYFLIKFINKQKFINLFYLSLALGLTALIRPQIYYIYIVIFFIFFFILSASFLKKISFFLFFLLIFKSCLFSWEFRNFKVYDNFFFVLAKEANLIGYYLPHFDQYENNLNLVDAKKERRIKWNEYLEKNYKDKKRILVKDISSLFDRDNIALDYFISELFKYKFSSIFQAIFFGSMKTLFAPTFVDIGYFFHLKKTSFSLTEGFSFLEQSTNFLKKNFKEDILYFTLFTFSLIITLILRLIQILGFVILFKKNMKLSLVFFSLIIFFLAMLGPLGAPKYRIPFEFFFSIYLIYGINFIIQISKKT